MTSNGTETDARTPIHYQASFLVSTKFNRVGLDTSINLAIGWYAQAGYITVVSICGTETKLQAIAKYDSYDPDSDEAKK